MKNILREYIRELLATFLAEKNIVSEPDEADSLWRGVTQLIPPDPIPAGDSQLDAVIHHY